MEEKKLYEVLSHYVSSITAASMARLGRTLPGEPPLSLPGLLARLQTGIRLYVDPSKQAQLQNELAQSLQPTSLPPPSRTWVSKDSDVALARQITRSLCEGLGVRALLVQQAATIASELSRNIVKYAGQGELRLEILDGAPRTLRIEAIDQGQGIKDLQAILEGRYVSKTGLGRGLCGVKRMAARFEISTGPTGTHVTAEVHW